MIGELAAVCSLARCRADAIVLQQHVRRLRQVDAVAVHILRFTAPDGEILAIVKFEASRRILHYNVFDHRIGKHLIGDADIGRTIDDLSACRRAVNFLSQDGGHCISFDTGAAGN